MLLEDGVVEESAVTDDEDDMRTPRLELRGERTRRDGQVDGKDDGMAEDGAAPRAEQLSKAARRRRIAEDIAELSRGDILKDRKGR